ncbi:MAG: ion transporter [Rhodospirillaceae bacterium]|nr:ion transporter [Magnetovibrio sp.]MAY66134.1 ion transporter [Rhodospirillaceae bacterium]
MASAGKHADLDDLKKQIEFIYTGRSKAALRFRLGLLAFDLVIIATYIAAGFFALPPEIYWLDLFLASFVCLDLLARGWIAENRLRFLANPFHWADLAVILSLVAPVFFGNFAFLRVLRALRVLRSYRVLQELRNDSSFFRRNEEVIQRSLNLAVFVFIVSAFVHAVQTAINPDIKTYTDAIYFTVAALTTTGFGDIVLVGESGRWLSIAILIFGVGLFLRLLQSVFRPPKIRHKCGGCGLLLHEPDALHCKHCGREISIETEGASE